ncbi:hypothetical protein BS50DRAFT_260919 [Corynespora cassiicola Philippines]|uniref:NACHT domain-containing protein n=1 Tax=Corynespora cassiicola Philippines TaxID=1448308 RepID=A0A2T2N1I4_CORCC|nr:hypothetical protein BS50DRAFT_260919 [Corynespora cassiicola Philippines]
MSGALPIRQQRIGQISARGGSQIAAGIFYGNVQFGNIEDSRKGAFEQAASACRNALFLTDPYTDRESIRSAKGVRVTGTCEWIAYNDSYCDWLDGNTRLLWISGGPGKGKTMLSVFLTEQLEQKVSSMADTRLIFYFFNGQDEKRNTAVAMLRGLVHQIITERPQLVKHALSHFETPKRAQQTTSSLETLWIIFSRLIEDPGIGTMFCVIDGLDECNEDERKTLVPRIVSLLSSKTPSSATQTFKMVLVSREMRGLRDCATMKLDPDNNENVASDIERFVSTRVESLSKMEGFDDGLRAYVRNTLLMRAEGTFLWAGFAVNELSQKETSSEVLELLEDLPSGLPAIYSRMLLQIPTDRRRTSCSILQWVTMSMRPLSLEELAAAVGVHSSSLLTAEQAIRDEVALCGPFLKVQEREVVLVHQSARDYLLRKGSDSNSVLEGFRINPETAHFKLAQACLDCVACSGLQHALVDLEDKSCPESPLLRYAVLHWPEHAKQCSALAASLFSLSKPIFQKNSTLRKYWWATHHRIIGKMDESSLPPLLHME